MAPKGNVRVRFAPSPTGQLHVGNARTALFNWLFARQQRATMVLRIEDTDVERSETRYEDQLLADLKWFGLDWDEGPDLPNGGGPFGPYRQSERLAIYREHAERLLAEGKAYLCFCTDEELQRERDRAVVERRQQIHPGPCPRLDPAEAQRRRSAGEACAIRLRIPEHAIRFHDLVRGDVEFPNEVINDPVILRSSGMPVYNYVVVIDDALMKITHVIRGDDHLSNTPKQVALYEALGWPVPKFAHLSTILGPDRTRLSKRHGATSIANFREMGVLPQALFNYLALLGWAPTGGTREIFSRDELTKEFALARVTPSAAVFDLEKLAWLNRHYIKQLPAQDLRMAALPYFVRAGLLGGPERPDISVDELEYELSASPEVWDWFGRIVELLAPAVDMLSQLPGRAARILYHDPQAALASPDNAEVLAWPKTNVVIESFARKVEAEAGPLTPERFKQLVNEVKTEVGVKGKELFHPIRVVLTGAHSGPEFDKVIPIIEQGSRLQLPRHVPSVRERVEAFVAAKNLAPQP